MSDRDKSVDGDKSSSPGLAGLTAAVKGVKAAARKVAHRSRGSKHDAPRGGGR
jgi:hypothetical protein